MAVSTAFNPCFNQSKDKTCGICMELVMRKRPNKERRFGILSNCRHTYCLSCIRQWRATKELGNKLVRTCPECRIESNLVVPSRYWIESQEEKEKLIEDFKNVLSTKPCKYFRHGKGKCPFGEQCLYQHVYADGTKACPPVPKPSKLKQPILRVRNSMQNVIVSDFLRERDGRRLFRFPLNNMLEFLSDSSEDEVETLLSHAFETFDFTRN